MAENSEYEVQGAQYAASEIRELVSRIPISKILSLDSGPAADMRVALTQVNKTYRAANEAIDEFFMAGMAEGSIDTQPFVQMARGSLEDEIESRRGHCNLIGIHYHNQLRDFLSLKLSHEEMDQADMVFGTLSEADEDLFKLLGRIGSYLTKQSAAVVNMLFGRDQAAARAHVEQVYYTLEPLRAELSNAMSELRLLERRLGFAEPR